MDRHLRGSYNLFSAHVANVPTAATEEDLREIFSVVGVVMEMYLAPKIREDSRFTYAFIRYKTAEEVQEACEVLNGEKMENARLKVTLSTTTRERIMGGIANDALAGSRGSRDNWETRDNRDRLSRDNNRDSRDHLPGSRDNRDNRDSRDHLPGSRDNWDNRDSRDNLPGSRDSQDNRDSRDNLHGSRNNMDNRDSRDNLPGSRDSQEPYLPGSRQRRDDRPTGRRDRDNHSIMRPSMPRMERSRFTVMASDERALHQKLKSSLNILSTDKEVGEWLDVKNSDDIKEFMRDLKNAIVSISNVPFGVGSDAVRLGADKPKKSALEDIIMRYHGAKENIVPFKEVDIDISDNKFLSDGDRLKLFPCLSSVELNDPQIPKLKFGRR